MRDLDPDLGEAREFAEAIHEQFPGKLLAYNCSPSFNWKKNSTTSTIAKFQRELGAMGYRFQFVTLAGFHALNPACSSWRARYRSAAWPPTRSCRSASSRLENARLTATRHQREVGTGYFDAGRRVRSRGGRASTLALRGSTEDDQFARTKG